MGLDVRWPIGWLFIILGLLLIIYGLFSDPALYQRSLGLNINLIWGSTLLGFGGLMRGLAQRAQRKESIIKKGTTSGSDPRTEKLAPGRPPE